MKTERLNADAAGLARAAELLRAGELVAFPTETVYGLGGIASNDAAVRGIFEAKGRPADRPVIVHVASADMLDSWGTDIPNEAHAVAAEFWPGPLTLIVPRSPAVSDAVTGGRLSVGIRVPSHPIALQLLALVGDGVAAPSANRYGHISPTTADHVLADLDGRIGAVVDGGPCAVGLESTIVEVLPTNAPGGETQVSILRHGGVPLTEIEQILGRSIVDGTSGSGDAARAPGMTLSHYAPNAPLLIVAEAEADQAPADVVVVRAEKAETDHTFAAELYARLRSADESNPHEIWVVPPLAGDLLPAILDRLTRAAHRGEPPAG